MVVVNNCTIRIKQGSPMAILGIFGIYLVGGIKWIDEFSLDFKITLQKNAMLSSQP